jgi:transposase
MPRRQRASSRPAPAPAAWLQPRKPPAAGSDIGATALWGGVPPSAVMAPAAPRAPALLPRHGRGCGAFPADVYAMAAWWRQGQGTTVAMASPGVSWRPRYDVRESDGCQGLLGDPRQVPRAPNRPQTAGHAWQWLQRLHRLGVLTAACRPAEPSRGWRASQRQRAPLSADAGQPLQRRAPALEQRHVTLPEVLSALTGLTGLRLLRALVRGARDAQAQAPLRDPRGKARAAPIAGALPGTWPPEPLCAVPQSLALYDDDHEHIRDGDRVSERPRQGRAVPAVPPLAPTRRGRRRRDNAGTVDARQRGQPVAGVAWTAIAGLAERPARIVLSASGLARSRGPSAKPWGRWLGLAPHPKQAGGRGPSRATRPGGTRAAPAWRLAAQHLQRAPRALGAFCRRRAARRGLAKAITAPAEKLARLIEALLQHGRASVAQGLAADALAYRERGGRQMTRKAAALGLMRVARDVVAQPS